MFSTFRLMASLQCLRQQSCHLKMFNRGIGQLKKLEERKLERLIQLRSIVMEFYRKQKEKNPTATRIDLKELQFYLNDNHLSYKTNAEFLLLSAFQTSTTPDEAPIDKSMFQAIADLVYHSPSTRNNKIAASRFCLYLSDFPHYLTSEQCQFIKRTAEEIVSEKICSPAIKRDILSSLAKSSIDNCRYAFQLFSQIFNEQDQDDSNFKIFAFNQLLECSVYFGLIDELEMLLRDQFSYLSVNMERLDSIINLLSNLNVDSLPNNRLINFFNLLSRLYAPLSLKSKQPIIELFRERLKYKKVEENVHISREGVCNCCGTKLKGLSRVEYDQLRSHFRSIIFDKNEKYLMSNLVEFELQLSKFESLIKLDPNSDRPKFDLIVDGLNLGYNRASSFVPDPKGLRAISKVYKIKDVDEQLTRILSSKMILPSYKNILIIGREHMKQWRQFNKLLQDNRDRLTAIFLKNRTRDDNYMLLAAIQHPSTMLLSSDLFRDHRAKFNQWYNSLEGNANRPNLHQYFIRWLRSRQIKIDLNGFIRIPNTFDSMIQFNDGVIHIPIVTEVDKIHQENHTIQWICAQP